MARVLLVHEGVPQPNGRVLMPGALYWKDEIIPVTTAELAQGAIVGDVSDIRREDDGRITAETSVDTRNHDIVLYLNNIELEPWCSQAVHQNQKITKGRLRAVVLGEKSYPNPVDFENSNI